MYKNQYKKLNQNQWNKNFNIKSRIKDLNKCDRILDKVKQLWYGPGNGTTRIIQIMNKHIKLTMKRLMKWWNNNINFLLTEIKIVSLHKCQRHMLLTLKKWSNSIWVTKQKWEMSEEFRFLKWKVQLHFYLKMTFDLNIYEFMLKWLKCYLKKEVIYI